MNLERFFERKVLFVQNVGLVGLPWARLGEVWLG